MLFLTSYRAKPFMSKADQKRLLDLFGQAGAAPGTVAHYVAADNSGGWTLVEADSLAEGYAAILKYEEFLEFDLTPVLTIDEAVPHLLEALK